MTVSRPASKAIRYALTGALAGALMAGAATAGSGPSPAQSAGKVQAALAKGQAERAIDLAEPAVLRNPGDAGLRALLGQAYLRAGRFDSAVATLAEAMQLGDNGARTSLGLALAQVAIGQGRQAVTLLDASRDSIPAEDLGLAYALAGETGRGIAILSDGLRAGNVTAKLRQNLAYAYALDGRWREARIMMMQDVPADQIDTRINTWAMLSQPESYQKRVAALLSVPLRADSGRPANLALSFDAPSGQQPATEANVQAPEPVPAGAQTAELPATGAVAMAEVPASGVAFSAPVEAAPADAVAEPGAVANFASAFSAPSYTAEPVVQPFMQTVAAALAPLARNVPLRTASRKPASGGSHLVQLGSFASEQSARRSWNIFVARNPELRNFRMTITPVVVRGQNFWRVAAAGFQAGSANGMCSTVKARGGACFAYASRRPMPSDASPARFAVASGPQRPRGR